MKKALAIAAVLGLATVAAGCSQDYKGLGDAGVGKKLEAPREVVVMPDRFANVATACDGHGHRIYTTTRENATVTVIVDPSCPTT